MLCCWQGLPHRGKTKRKREKGSKVHPVCSTWRQPRGREENVVILDYHPKLGGWWGSGKRERIVIGKDPFAKGGFHAVHTATLGQERAQVVVKFAHEAPNGAHEACMVQLSAQLQAQHWAEQFNARAARAGQAARVQYSQLKAVELPARNSVALMEYFLEGEFQKFNDNKGHVFAGGVAQAFSHFTYEASGHKEVVCDIQGIVDGLFTDALLHSQYSEAYGGGRYGNRGRKGITDFLDSHRCGQLCGSLGLPPVSGCNASKAKGVNCKRCPRCGSQKWDAAYRACWKCDEEYLLECQMEEAFME